MTPLAYAGSIIMSPFKEMQGLEKLWLQIPQRKDLGYLPTAKHDLKALWRTTYKGPDEEVSAPNPPNETFDYEYFTTMRLELSGRASRVQVPRDTPCSDTPRRRNGCRKRQKKHITPAP
jgi:hypothetical protein